MDQITITTSGDIEGITISVSAKIPSDAARYMPEGLISGFGASELLHLAQCVAAKLPALLGSAAFEVQGSLIEVAKSRKSHE